MDYDEPFFKVLFWHLPVTAMILDHDRRVHLANRTLQILFRHKDEQSSPEPFGNFCSCAYSTRDVRGCGHAPQCKKCIIKSTVLQAINGHSVIRAKGSITTHNVKGISFLKVLITATPLTVNGLKMALLIIEDIANVTQLNGLLPICSCCKKIRSEEGLWLNFEQYIERHSEAQFTHDYCPDCINQLYRSYEQSKAGT